MQRCVAVHLEKRKRACAFDPRVAGPNPASPLVLAAGWAGFGGGFSRPQGGRVAAAQRPFCGLSRPLRARAAAAQRPRRGRCAAVNPPLQPNLLSNVEKRAGAGARFFDFKSKSCPQGAEKV